jgi:hypothetical protein
VSHASRDGAIAAYLQGILDSNEFPAFSRRIQEVLAQLQDEHASLDHLTDVVLREYSLTLKVLRTAHSAHFQRWGAPPSLSASRAMALIGAKTLRDLANGLLLFEHFHKHSPGVRQLMVLSMLTANHARALAVRLGYPGPEEAYLCGMFHNLGEVLVACHFPAEYARILAATQEPATDAEPPEVAVLGFRYQDLGAAMARHWGLNVVAGSMLSAGGADRLGEIVGLSHALTTGVYRQDEVKSAGAVGRLVAGYGSALGISEEQLGELLEVGITETRETITGMGIGFSDLRLRRQVEAAVKRSSGGDAAQERMVSDLDAALKLEAGFDLNRVLQLVLESAHRGGPFDRALLCLLNQDRSELQARFGYGDGADTLVERFRFGLSSQGGSLSAALTKQKDAYVNRDRPISWSDGQFMRLVGAESFAVLPLTVRGAVVGCLYLDRLTPQPAPDERTTRFLERLRAQAERALDLRRLARAPAGATGSSEGAWSAEAKADVVLKLLRGAAIAELSRETGVGEAELEQWRQEFLAGALARLRDGHAE